MDNYTIYHMHSDISNLTAGTSADSITKFEDYILKAKELGMKSIAISEHGSVMNWINKKRTIESNVKDENGILLYEGMKYIHANEVYLTQKIDKDNDGNPIKIRDNYHYMLIAKNYDG